MTTVVFVEQLDIRGFWCAAIPQEHWPDIPAIRSQIEARWDTTVGDCRQEHVFIGIGMDEISIYDSLQECLLTDDEMRRGIEAWRNFEDPFPKWQISLDEVTTVES